MGLIQDTDDDNVITRHARESILRRNLLHGSIPRGFPLRKSKRSPRMSNIFTRLFVHHSPCCFETDLLSLPNIYHHYGRRRGRYRRAGEIEVLEAKSSSSTPYADHFYKNNVPRRCLDRKSVV